MFFHDLCNSATRRFCQTVFFKTGRREAKQSQDTNKTRPRAGHRSAPIAATTPSAATAALVSTNGTASNPSPLASSATIASTAVTSATSTATATVTGGYTLRQAAEHCLSSIFFLFFSDLTRVGNMFQARCANPLEKNAALR